jgi:DNA (cytosine-5)-methyltransferase 1
MASRGWPGADRWREGAQGIAPTLVGGSKKHGGPDLGPTRARRQWKALGVDGLGVWDEPPGPLFPMHDLPRLTVQMAALIQGFPPDWHFAGRKTAAYRQVGNAFPPPVSQAVAEAIAAALKGRGKRPAAATQSVKTGGVA